MKTKTSTIFVFLLLVFCAAVNAQPKGEIPKFFLWDASLEIKYQAFSEFGNEEGLNRKNKVKTITTTDYDSLVFEIQKFDKNFLLTESIKYFAEGSMNKSRTDTSVERSFYNYDKNRRTTLEKTLRGKGILEKKYFYIDDSTDKYLKFETYINSELYLTTYFHYNKFGKIDSVIAESEDTNLKKAKCYFFYNDKGRLESVLLWDNSDTKINYDNEKFTFDDDGLTFEYYFKDKKNYKWIAYVKERKIVTTDLYYYPNGLKEYGKSVFTSEKNKDRPLVRRFIYTYYED